MRSRCQHLMMFSYTIRLSSEFNIIEDSLAGVIEWLEGQVALFSLWPWTKFAAAVHGWNNEAA